MFKFGKKSLMYLDNQVHPDLVKVCHKALEYSPYDFGIIESKRTVERQQELINMGKSWTMKSKHLVQPDGYVHAIDFMVYDETGKGTWEEGYYRKVIQAFVRATIEVSVQVEFGGLWKSVFDGPHVELSDKYY